MGRAALVALTAFAAACVESAPPPAGADPHAGLACAECHQGATADRALATVPSETCASSGCHDRGVPTVTWLASVRFEHARHASGDGVAAGCAGCHTHDDGRAPLGSGAETCGLCHADQLSGARGADCRVCHEEPSHSGLTSQGVAVPHEGLPWIEGGCLRCHYEVAEPVHQVDLARCEACHDDVTRVTTQGIGEDLHPLHEASGCRSCHSEDEHRIEAMSSAVDLACSDCHESEHAVELRSAGVGAETCNQCHAGIHADAQRMLLGIVPMNGAAAPSDHFMDGLTCRSCHVARASAGTPLEGSAEACVGCHRREYATVARWWREGIAQRVGVVERYLTASGAATPDGDPGAPASEAGQAAARARALLGLVDTGGGMHNLALAHRMLEGALESAAEARRLSGRPVPSVPSLGRPPRQGICTYCHYRLDELGLTEGMDDAFHREVLGAR